MSKPIIVLGDKTDHGGVVISGTPQSDIDGKPIARIGDKVSCPACKGVFPIASGDATVIVDGQPVARHGDRTACGATLIAGQQMHAFVDAGGANGAVNDTGKGAEGLLGRSLAGASPLVRSSKSGENSSAYDEQLRFINPRGAHLAGVDYRLELADGTVRSGRTDERGRTQRIATDAPVHIAKAELSSRSAPCCALHADLAESSPSLVVTLDRVVTNAADLGGSIAETRVPDAHVRALTAGEIAMARWVFADSVDYSRVKVHRGEYLWFGLQPDDTAMTPDGEMYFNEKHFLDDFSTAPLAMQQWFMHEMTHVWQYQLGYPVKVRGALRIGLSYRYVLEPRKRLGDYNMEAQGNILADYFVVKFRGAQAAMYEARYRSDPAALQQLETVLADFLREPSRRSNLP